MKENADARATRLQNVELERRRLEREAEEKPVTVFDQGVSENFSFSAALTLLKTGTKVCRRGWNGRGMFLFFVPAGALAVPQHLPCEGESIGEFIAMKTAQNTVIPWLASQTDLLAHDWMVVS